MNLLNQQLKAIQTSKAYLKKEIDKEKDPHIKEKIQHYITGLEKEEEQLLTQIGEQ